MALIYAPTATATVAANTNSIAIAGIDLASVLPGMVITLGSRGKITGDGYIIQGVVPNGSNGGTVTTVEPVATSFNNAAWIVDSRDFNGSAPNYMINQFQQLQNTLLRLTSPLTNLFSGSRTVALDKDSPGAISRLLYAIAGRTWLGAEQRTLGYTPTGGSLTSVETFALRAYPDGTTPTDAVLIDLTTGGCDVQLTSATMVANTTVDLSSAPTGKVLITGSASIASFGNGKHKVREVHFQDAGAVLVHSATSLFLPFGGANILVAAGDVLRATSDASGNWRVRSYTRADGTPLKGAPNTAYLDPGTGKLLAAHVPDALLGGVRYQGSWNASTNSPALPAPSAANKGFYYIVLTAGATSLSGPTGPIAEWQVGDWAISDGTYWEKIDNTDQVVSVAGLQGVISAASLKAALVIGLADVSGLQAALDARIRFDTAQTLSAGQKTQAQSNLGIPNGNMTSYTSVLTSNNGTISQYQLVVSKYQMINTKLCLVVVDFVVNTAGTANGQVPFFTLPFTASGTYYAGSGRNQSSGQPLQIIGNLNDNRVTMVKLDGTGPIENGARFTANILFEVA